MTSIIIAIVSIALTVLLSIAGFYYTSSTATQKNNRIAAASLISQAQQIQAAYALAQADGISLPAELHQIPPRYLATFPAPPAASVTSESTSSMWAYYTPDSSHFGIEEKISKDVCQEINRMAGFSGIPYTWVKGYQFLCAGTPDGYSFIYNALSPQKSNADAVIAKSLQSANRFIAKKGAVEVFPDYVNRNPYSISAVSEPGYPVMCADASLVMAGICPKESSSGSGDNAAVVWTLQGGEIALSKEINAPESWHNIVIVNSGTAGQRLILAKLSDSLLAQADSADIDFSDCSNIVQPGNTCTLWIRLPSFATTIDPAIAASVDITSDGSQVVTRMPASLRVRNAVIEKSVIGLSTTPDALNFSASNATTRQEFVILKNISLKNIQLSGFGLSGDVQSPASTASPPFSSRKKINYFHNCPSTITPGATCTIQISFTGSASGDVNAVFFARAGNPDTGEDQSVDLFTIHGSSVSASGVASISHSWVRGFHRYEYAPDLFSLTLYGSGFTDAGTITGFLQPDFGSAVPVTVNVISDTTIEVSGDLQNTVNRYNEFSNGFTKLVLSDQYTERHINFIATPNRHGEVFPLMSTFYFSGEPTPLATSDQLIFGIHVTNGGPIPQDAFSIVSNKGVILGHQVFNGDPYAYLYVKASSLCNPANFDSTKEFAFYVVSGNPAWRTGGMSMMHVKQRWSCDGAGKLMPTYQDSRPPIPQITF